MTIDEKIKQAAERYSSDLLAQVDYILGASLVKSEMLADMQKLAEALEFYADMAKDDNQNLDDCLELACIHRAESKEYNLSGKYIAKKALQALAEFNAKYLKKEK